MKSVAEKNQFADIATETTNFLKLLRFAPNFCNRKKPNRLLFRFWYNVGIFPTCIDSQCKNIAQRAMLNFAFAQEILPEVLRYPRRRFTTIKCIIDEDFPKQFSTRTTRQRRKNRVKGLSDKSKLRLVFKSMLP